MKGNNTTRKNLNQENKKVLPRNYDGKKEKKRRQKEEKGGK
jgi:hypothetical protein